MTKKINLSLARPGQIIRYGSLSGQVTRIGGDLNRVRVWVRTEAPAIETISADRAALCELIGEAPAQSIGEQFPAGPAI